MDALDQWKRGTPLEDAWFKFAPPVLRAEYNRYERGDVYGIPPELDLEAISRGEKLKLPPNYGLQIGEQLGLIEPPVGKDMRERVFELVRKGKLVAVGVPVKPNPGVVPVLIPDTLIRDNFFKWNKSVISGGGFSYRDVRLFQPNKSQKAVPTQAAASPPAPIPPIKKPRPISSPLEERKSDLRRAVILNEFRRLRDAGELPKPHNQTRIAKKLEQILSKNHPDLFPAGRGLGEKNIYRILKDESGF
jgi:hypothetical protein